MRKLLLVGAIAAGLFYFFNEDPKDFLDDLDDLDDDTTPVSPVKPLNPTPTPILPVKPTTPAQPTNPGAPSTPETGGNNPATPPAQTLKPGTSLAQMSGKKVESRYDVGELVFARVALSPENYKDVDGVLVFCCRATVASGKLAGRVTGIIKDFALLQMGGVGSYYLVPSNDIKKTGE